MRLSCLQTIGHVSLILILLALQGIFLMCDANFVRNIHIYANNQTMFVKLSCHEFVDFADFSACVVNSLHIGLCTVHRKQLCGSLVMENAVLFK